jgi:lysophospholipid acyltransferase (LPLAT)-like uncharacterized protein
VRRVVREVVTLARMPSFRDYFWSRGEPWNSMRSSGVPLLFEATHSILMLSLRLSVSGAAQLPAILDRPEDDLPERGALFCCWHDHTLLPLHLFRHKRIAVMMSRSRAGQMQAAFWRRYGWPTIWGSSKKREGIQALREVVRTLRAGQSCAFTPDGPKGPRRRAHSGIVYLASNAPAAIIPLGVAADSAWKLPTWDRYLIPKPFARVHVHLGEPLLIPPAIPKAEMAAWQERVEEEIDRAVQVCRERLGLEPEPA